MQRDGKPVPYEENRYRVLRQIPICRFVELSRYAHYILSPRSGTIIDNCPLSIVNSPPLRGGEENLPGIGEGLVHHLGKKPIQALPDGFPGLATLHLVIPVHRPVLKRGQGRFRVQLPKHFPNLGKHGISRVLPGALAPHVRLLELQKLFCQS